MLKNFKKQVLISISALLIMSVMTLSVVDKLVPVSRGLDLRREDFIFLKDAKGIKRSPKILVYTASSTGGQKMTAEAILQRLPDCEAQAIDVFCGPLKGIEPSDTKAQSLIRKDIIKRSPDLVLSAAPFVNGLILDATKALNIPFVVVPTEVDISAFISGINETKLLSDHPSFKLTVPYAKDMWDPLFSDKIPDEMKQHLVYNFSYPTRMAFSKKISSDALDHIKKNYQIKEDEHLVLVMMGKENLIWTKAYAELIATCSYKELEPLFESKAKKIHLLCLCGDENEKENKALVHELNSIKSPSHIKIQGVFSTPKIAEIVSLRQTLCVISTPGSSTMNEMIQKKVPMIYHTSNQATHQEHNNICFGQANRLGLCFDECCLNSDDARAQLISILFEMQEMRKELKKDKPIDAFSQNLRSTIKSILN